MFPIGDLARMQAAQQAHMPDTCHRSVYSSTINDYGSPVETWTENVTDIPCGVDQRNDKSEELQKDMTVTLHDATIRLPFNQSEVWNIKDKIIVTKRFGTAITPIVYGIVSPVRTGASGVLLKVQKVEL